MKKFRVRKLVVFIAVVVALSLASTAHANIARNQYAFSEFKNLIENQYIFRDYKGVNWEDLYSRHENQILNSQTDDQFALNLEKLLGEVKDYHLWVCDTKGNQLMITKTIESFVPNYNLNAIARIIPNLQKRDGDISTAIVDNVGYLMMNSWTEELHDNEILYNLLQTNFLNTDALIIDLRMNGGGYYRYPIFSSLDGGYYVLCESESFFFGSNENEQPIFTGYFETMPITGTIFEDRIILPTYIDSMDMFGYDGIPYVKPIIILIGQKTASAGEWFAMDMSYLPHVTIMGEQTPGVMAGTPTYTLSNNIQVKIPFNTRRDINNNHVEDVGITPDVYVPFVNDGSDNVLIRAFADLGVVVGSGGGGNTSGSGGGGCNTGFMGILLILALIAPLTSRKK